MDTGGGHGEGKASHLTVRKTTTEALTDENRPVSGYYGPNIEKLSLFFLLGFNEDSRGLMLLEDK